MHQSVSIGIYMYIYIFILAYKYICIYSYWYIRTYTRIHKYKCKCIYMHTLTASWKIGTRRLLSCISRLLLPHGTTTSRVDLNILHAHLWQCYTVTASRGANTLKSEIHNYVRICCVCVCVCACACACMWCVCVRERESVCVRVCIYPD